MHPARILEQEKRNNRHPPAGSALLPLLLSVLALTAWFRQHPVMAQSPSGSRLTIYSPGLSYALPVSAQSGHDFVGLFESLEPLGAVELKPSGKVWELQVSRNDPGSSGKGSSERQVRGEFIPGKAEVTVDGSPVSLPAPAIFDGGHVMVSTDSLPVLLDAFLGEKSTLHAAARRLFVNTAGLQPSVELKQADAKSGSGATLVLSFTAPVNPEVSTNGNQVRLLFSREPVLAGNTGAFDDSLIKGIQFQESNGVLEATVSGTAPLMARFQNDGKEIGIGAASAPPAPAPQPASGDRNATVVGPPQAQSGPGAAGPAGPVIVLDPGHGGSDPGARIDAGINEKDIVLTVARRLRSELQNRGFSPILLRDGDATIDPNQRAMNTNAAMPALYLCIHASTTATGVHLYTSMLPAVSPVPVFAPWDSAQAGYVQKSEHMAMALGDALNQANLPTIQGKAILRPLDNIAAPAVAIEFSPFDNGGEREQVGESSYQQTLVATIANALASSRGTLGAAN